MSKNNGRDPKGRFVKGGPPGPGRPTREVEESYMACLGEVCSIDEWKAIVVRAVTDARDGDATARAWLSRYLVTDKSAVNLNLKADKQGMRILEIDDWYDNKKQLNGQTN